MAGGSHSKPPPSSSSSTRKSRWESSTPSAKPPSNPNKSTDRPKPAKPNNPSPRLTTNAKPSPNHPKTTAATTNSSAVATEPISTPPVPSKFPFPDPGPPPPPTYGFHMLDRRTIVLADGSVRSYFALPPDYQDFPPLPRPPPPQFLPPPLGPDSSSNGPRFPPMSPEGLGMGFHPLKRKFEDPGSNGMYPVGMDYRAGTSSPYRRELGVVDEFVRAGKFLRVDGAVGLVHKHLEVDPVELKKAFLHFTKVINESEGERKRYLEDGKRLRCLACGRTRNLSWQIKILVWKRWSSGSYSNKV